MWQQLLLLYNNIMYKEKARGENIMCNAINAATLTKDTPQISSKSRVLHRISCVQQYCRGP